MMTTKTNQAKAELIRRVETHTESAKLHAIRALSGEDEARAYHAGRESFHRSEATAAQRIVDALLNRAKAVPTCATCGTEGVEDDAACETCLDFGGGR